MDLRDIPLTTIDGETTTLAEYDDRVVLVVNVASRCGLTPQYEKLAFGFPGFFRNITLTGGVAPARAYIEELLPDVLDGTIQPGRVFDRTVALDEVPDGYRAMAGREALKVLIRP